MPSAEDIVDLTSTPSEATARSIVAALAEAGVDASVVGGMLAGFRAEAPAMARVVVRRADLERAKALLADVRAESAAIDWEKVDVGEAEGGVDVDGRCYRCRYHLVGLEDPDRCPECGAWLRAGPEPGAPALPQRDAAMLHEAGRPRVWLILLLTVALGLGAVLVMARGLIIDFVCRLP